MMRRNALAKYQMLSFVRLLYGLHEGYLKSSTWSTFTADGIGGRVAGTGDRNSIVCCGILYLMILEQY